MTRMGKNFAVWDGGGGGMGKNFMGPRVSQVNGVQLRLCAANISLHNTSSAAEFLFIVAFALLFESCFQNEA